MKKASNATARSASKAPAKARKAKALPLTPGQKAAATKRANGLDLSAVARKAHATRAANKLAAERETKRLARLAKRQEKAQAQA